MIMMIRRQNPYKKELENVIKREQKFLQSRQEKRDNLLNRKISEKVPQRLQKTLNDMFYLAFLTVFEKGTGVIEKTYKREEMEKNFLINQYADEIKNSKKTAKAFSKQAESAKVKNLMLSGVSGIGMGAFGVGIPDIPVFTGMVLKSIYEIALSYGFEYETQKERYFILLLIQGAMSYGADLKRLDCMINRFIEDEQLPENYDKTEQMQSVSLTLSMELLYMKFLQGIPIVGAVGGAYDAIYINQISEYANLKYKRRFLHKRI